MEFKRGAKIQTLEADARHLQARNRNLKKAKWARLHNQRGRINRLYMVDSNAIKFPGNGFLIYSHR